MVRFWTSRARAVQRPFSLWTSRAAPTQCLPTSYLSICLPIIPRRGRFFSASSTSPSPPHLLDRVLAHAPRVALYEDGASTSWTYAQLLDEAVRLCDVIRTALPLSTDASAPRVACLGSRDASYVAMQWATWLAGGVAVPLHPTHPPDELQYIVDDSDACVLIVSEGFLDRRESKHELLYAWIQQLHSAGKIAVVPYARPTPLRDDANRQNAAETVVRTWLHDQHKSNRRRAHIVYTSGTTGRPKGVVATHAALTAQAVDIVTAWEMTEQDHLLHFLPLHHVHGILNNLVCTLYAGGSLEFLPAATPSLVWRKLLEGQSNKDKRPVTMLMAVPTVYMNLLEEMEKTEDAVSYDKQAAVHAARQLRVAISGSMACPVSILNRWEALTGLRLLERYGMTELGMVLTNPLHGERHLGYVGQPFPSVTVRLVDPETDHELPLESEAEGELRVKGPTVFREYWCKPEATAKEFDAEGWFKTGDIAQYDNAKQSFRIRGRASADILKSGGYKISALDIERVLLTFPGIVECAVFGIADDKWGQIVSAVLRVNEPVDEAIVRTFCREHVADYCVPRKLFVVDAIPKNAMGKVNKKALALQFGAE